MLVISLWWRAEHFMREARTSGMRCFGEPLRRLRVVSSALPYGRTLQTHIGTTCRSLGEGFNAFVIFFVQSTAEARPLYDSPTHTESNIRASHCLCLINLLLSCLQHKSNSASFGEGGLRRCLFNGSNHSLKAKTPNQGAVVAYPMLATRYTTVTKQIG